MKNEFFSPTPLFKEYLVLDTIDKNKQVTQREISNIVKVSLSMVNQYLKEYEDSGYIIKDYISPKNVLYHLTPKGVERMRYLNIGYLNSTQRVYKQAKVEILSFIDDLIYKGFKDIIFYGAGEVAEILLQTLNDDNSIPINVVGVIDDNKKKQDKIIVNNTIKDISIVNNTKHDAILISSYTSFDDIIKKLKDIKYPMDNVVYFFK